MDENKSVVTNPLTGLPVDDQELHTLSDLVNQQINLESEINNVEQRLKSLKAQLEAVSTKQIPDRMDAIGLKSLILSNGRKVELKPFFSAKILDGGFKWLDDNGHGGIIKTTVQRQFTRDERDEAKQFAAEHDGFALVESVHHQTLGAFVKEIYVNKHETLPEDLFSVYQGARTKVS